MDRIGKGLTLFGSWHYNLKYVPKIMRMIDETGSQLDRPVSHRFRLEREVW